MRRVALFPGAFSPVHQGHVEVVDAVLRMGLFDVVTLVPATDAYAKPGLLDGQTRLAALQHRMQSIPNVEISTIDLCKTWHPRVIDTLREIIASAPSDAFALVMGADRIEWMSEHARQELVDTLVLMPIVVVARGTIGRSRIGELTEGYRGCVTTLPAVSQVSSTELRACGWHPSAAGASVAEVVPRATLGS
jgi:nicotinic acid mononucleotide adenylyltransferase